MYLDYLLEQIVNPECDVHELGIMDVPVLPPNIAYTPQSPLQDTVHEQLLRFGSNLLIEFLIPCM